jgi:hypothetical protein
MSNEFGCRVPGVGCWVLGAWVLVLGASCWVSSGPANLSEGFAHYRHKESARYVRIAKGTLTETHNHPGDGIDRGYWTAERCEPLRNLADRAIGATTEWLKYLTSSAEPP